VQRGASFQQVMHLLREHFTFNKMAIGGWGSGEYD